jgi:hypothetical protein
MPPIHGVNPVGVQANLGVPMLANELADRLARNI